MLFNSFNFLVFFPLVTAIYFLLPHRFRWIHLLICSCVFYCFFVPEYLSILALTIVVDYAAGIYIEKSAGNKRKWWLIISIVVTCLILFAFKYYNFFASSISGLAEFFGLHYPVKVLSILLPIGLSFHTFQSLSYVIEVYRGNQKAERHFGIYALYVLFYPQLVAGPIERPQNMLHQFREKHEFEYDHVISGLKKILWGIFKKIVIADRLAVYVDLVYNNQEHHNGPTLMLATVFFAFQIYCDFSGYSDIAIGVARVMGFKLMTNFNRPYLARSVAEFWKRWHISLSTWFKDYVYIPLGGNRVSKIRLASNLLLTFAISGLWHGANWTFVIWGTLNGIYLVISNWIGQKHRPVYHILLTFCLIAFSWIFFRAQNLSQALMIVQKIGTTTGGLYIGDPRSLAYGVFFLTVLLITECAEEFKWFNSFSLFANDSKIVRRGSYLLVVLIVLLFGVLDNSQFIYFQF